jgi:hypothetical protein
MSIDDDEDLDIMMLTEEQLTQRALYNGEYEFGKEHYKEEIRRRDQFSDKFNSVLTIIGLFASLGLFSAKVILDTLSQFFNQCIVLYIIGLLTFVLFMVFVSWAIFVALSAMKAHSYKGPTSLHEFRRKHTIRNDRGEEFIDPQLSEVQIKIDLSYHYEKIAEYNSEVNEKRTGQYNHCLIMLKLAFICALILLGMLIPMQVIKSHSSDNIPRNEMNQIH